MVSFVVPHNPGWKAAFHREATAINAALAPLVVELHHIGSTSIKGILAKPIIDLLGIARDLGEIDTCTDAFEQMGYEAMGDYGIDNRRYFRKINADGRRTHHLHIFADGSPHIERHLAFRDFLLAHPARAAEYSDLKKKLTSGDNPSWDGYLDGKEPFILAVEQQAVEWLRSR